MWNIDEVDKFAIMAEGVWIEFQSEAGTNRTINIWLLNIRLLRMEKIYESQNESG
jgi:hypothetical protein